MKGIVLVHLSLMMVGATQAFVVPFRAARVPSMQLRMSELVDADVSGDDSVLQMKPDDDDAPVEGSHAELMYTLGVNLARQLGDVRPLVENGQELAQVAKGLLDTVIGRLEEDGQRALLARRGTELNELITFRA